VSVRGVDGDDVDARFDERLDALIAILPDAHRRAAAEPPAAVARRERMATRGLDVLERDESLQALLAIDDEELLDLVRLEDVLRRLEIRARTT
jgi:hypothetical protein